MEYRIPIWKGHLIKHFREAANRTQAELSELLERDFNFKYDSNSISRLERDDVVPNRLVVERIAHALKIPPVNFCDSAEIKEFLDGQRVPGPGAVGNEPDSGEPQIAYDVNELISNYESMPSRYAELDLTLVFENAGWYAAEVNEVVELGLSRGATVTGVICVVAAERTHL